MAYSIHVLSHRWRGFEGLGWLCSSFLMVVMCLGEARVSVKAAPVLLKEVALSGKEVALSGKEVAFCLRHDGTLMS